MPYLKESKTTAFPRYIYVFLSFILFLSHLQYFLLHSAFQPKFIHYPFSNTSILHSFVYSSEVPFFSSFCHPTSFSFYPSLPQFISPPPILFHSIQSYLSHSILLHSSHPILSHPILSHHITFLPFYLIYPPFFSLF